ncbi:MAG: hypothetical protein ACYTAN_09635, partial [Planctomycetota bacterium]|jgi:hypothetical protein
MPERMKNVITAKPLYQKFLADKHGDITELNAAWQSGYEYFWQIPFESLRPQGPRGADWELFVRKRLPMRDVLLDAVRCRRSYLEYIRTKYATVALYNAKTGDNAESLETARLSARSPQTTLALVNWQEYYENFAPVEAIILDTADVRFSRFLRGPSTKTTGPISSPSMRSSRRGLPRTTRTSVSAGAACAGATSRAITSTS